MNATEIAKVFSHESSSDIFSTAMPENRFKFLHQFIQFDDKATHLDRWKGSRFAALRVFFEEVNKESATHKTRLSYVSVTPS